MRIGVYNRYWNTAGGGEVYAGAMAEILGASHEVRLLSEEAVDVDRLRDRLGLELSGFPVDVLGEIDDEEFARTTAPYDLLINVTHGSHRPNGARRGIYIVHFPEGGPEAGSSASAAVVRRQLTRGRQLHFLDGVHPEESDGAMTWRWTDEVGTIAVAAPVDGSTVLVLDISTAARPHDAETGVEVRLDGTVVARHPSGSGESTFSVPLPAGRSFVTVRSDPFVPGGGDRRHLGVQLLDARLVGTRLVDRAARRVWPATGRAVTSDSHLETYHALVSNSAFTQRWLWKRLGRRSVLIHPPVEARQAGAKENIILSVGRFFGPESGHSKRQLEMVDAMRKTSDALEGWTLHLVGGSSARDAAYLELVQEAAKDVPVVVHVNAPRSTLDDLYSRASVYWHAAGLGEDERVHPERFEHFGISVVEAMSAGAVPIVLDRGGPASIVRRGRDGLHFGNLDELTAATRQLCGDPHRMVALSASAVERSRIFSRAAFRSRVLRLVEGV